MPSFKSITTFCALLLFTLIPHEFVKAQSGDSKIEAGVQFSVLGGRTGYWFDDGTSIGGGVRLTFDLMKSLALEGELNYFPSSGFNNVHRFQGQFGVKSGLRFDRFGVFGKVRPGFIDSEYDGARFSLDVGGVLEFYPSRRITVRFDVGDTIVNRREPPILFTDRFFALSRRHFAAHNLQLGAGVGFRF